MARNAALVEALRVRAYRRGSGLGREPPTHTIDRRRARRDALAQLTSGKRHAEAHRFYGSLGIARSYDGFRRKLQFRTADRPPRPRHERRSGVPREQPAPGRRGPPGDPTLSKPAAHTN